jgi:hypothetical protein
MQAEIALKKGTSLLGQVTQQLIKYHTVTPDRKC